MRVLFVFCLLFFSTPWLKAQQATAIFKQPEKKKTKGSVYFGAGFHRVFFTRSDIHFHDNKTANYNFTLYKVKAKDDNDFNIGRGFDAPQYSYRIGYYFKNRKDIGIEFSFDHVKYIAIQDQRLRVSGQINGTKLDKDTVLSRDFVQYEHTDGANYYLFNFVKRKILFDSKNEKQRLSLALKPGLGFVLPRTDSRIMGQHRDDKYHLSGYVIGLDGGLRYDFLKHFYFEASARGAFANYSNVLVYGAGRASQHWWSLQIIALAGFQFPL
jgi:hypothetical protein